MTEQEFNKNILGMRSRLIHFAGGFSTGGAATPEDMVQEAVMKVWNLNCSGEKVRSLEAMSIAILKNVCLDYMKLKKNHNEGMDCVKGVAGMGDEYQSPLQALEMKQKMALVKRFIKALPMDQQIVLRLRDVMGYEMDEIAKILDTSEGNVRTMLSRVRGKLKSYLIGVR
ncbi:MAG: sigma-70 family RNA polymerase sigma factor [Bacteroidales bacterium]